MTTHKPFIKQPAGIEERDQLHVRKDFPIAGGQGLRGHDKQQADLIDAERGTRDPANRPPDTEVRTASRDAQPGADVKADAPPIAAGFDVPEGLRRQRMGPYDKDTGRKGGDQSAQESVMPQGSSQKIVKDDRGQEQPADKKRAQQSENLSAFPNRDPAKKKTGEF